MAPKPHPSLGNIVEATWRRRRGRCRVTMRPRTRWRRCPLRRQSLQSRQRRCDLECHDYPLTLITGQAAGVAAALAAGAGTRPRDLAVSAIQRELLRQGVYLSATIEAAMQPASAAE